MPGEEEAWREWKGGRKTDEAKGLRLKMFEKHCHKCLYKVQC